MKKLEKPEIRELKMSDVPDIYSDIEYFNDGLAFADNITSIPDLQDIFKLTFVAFVFNLRGELSLKLNGTPYKLLTHDALYVDSGTVVSDIVHSDDFDCKIVAVGNNIGINFINKTVFSAIAQISSDPIVRFSPEEIELLMKYCDLASFKLKHKGLNYGNETMMLLLRSLALDLLSSVTKHVASGDSGMLRQGDKIYHRFLQLLATNDTCERSVQYFADKLYVSPKYLTSVCNEKSGQTASELIANSVSSRIRQLLIFSEKSIKEIALEMNFDNLSFFGKYVKKHLGDSPINFRKKHAYGR